MKVGDEVYLKNNPSMKGVIHSGSGHIICVDWANGTSDTHWGSSLILASEYDKENLKESKGHPNASILMEIAKEAAVNPEYWAEFEFDDEGWTEAHCQGELFGVIFNEHQVRRKPRAIRIGNYDVKKPVHLIAQKGCVSVFVETEEDAELMLKALQELLGAKK